MIEKGGKREVGLGERREGYKGKRWRKGKVKERRRERGGKERGIKGSGGKDRDIEEKEWERQSEKVRRRKGEGKEKGGEGRVGKREAGRVAEAHTWCLSSTFGITLMMILFTVKLLCVSV